MEKAQMTLHGFSPEADLPMHHYGATDQGYIGASIYNIISSARNDPDMLQPLCIGEEQFLPFLLSYLGC